MLIAQINFRNPIAALPLTPQPNDDVPYSLCFRGDGQQERGADVLTVSGKILIERHCTHSLRTAILEGPCSRYDVLL